MSGKLELYSPHEILENYKSGIFGDVISIRYPLISAGGFMKKIRRSTTFDKIQERVNSLSSEDKDKLLGGILLLDSDEDTLTSWKEIYEKFMAERYETLEVAIDASKSLFKGMDSKQKREVLREMLLKIKSDICGLQSNIRDHINETEDIETLLVIDDILTYIVKFADYSKNILESGSKEINRSLGLILALLIRLEKFRRGMINLDRLYSTSAYASRQISLIETSIKRPSDDLLSILAE